MNEKLLVRPDPFFDESIYSYFIRLTDVNGYETPNEIMRLLNEKFNPPLYEYIRLDYSFVNLPYNFIRELSEVTLKDINTLSRLVLFGVDYKYCKIFSSQIAYKIVRHKLRKYCPLCLKDKPYYRVIWDIMLFTACPIHKCRLFNKCLDCKALLPLNRNSIYKCNCGNDLRDTPPEILPDKDLRLSGHMMNQLGLLNSSFPYIQKDNPLINFSLKEFTNLIYYFVKRIIVISSEKILPVKKLGYHENTHHLCCKSLSVFDNYPLNYKKWLEITIKLKKPAAIRSINSYFHFYHPGISEALSPRQISFIYNTFNELAPELFEKYSKPYFKYEDDELINQETLGQVLNLESKVLRKLIKNKVIPIAKIKLIDDKPEYLFEGDIFLKIMDEIRSNCMDQNSLLGKTQMNLNQIYKYFNNINKFCGFLKLMLEGKIRPSTENLDADGLYRFWFSKEDVEKL